MIKKLCHLTLLSVFLMCSSWAQADGLFDFQMKLAKKGNAEAEFKVGEMYETGFGVKKDMKQAHLWVNKAAAQGLEAANFKLTYWNIQKNGLKGGNKKKYTEITSKAKDGNLQAMYYVGMMYAHGVGVKKNYDKALDWLNKATFGGVLAAEREAVAVRDLKQSALDNQRKTAEKSNKANEAKRKKSDAAKSQSAQEQQQELAEKRKRASDNAKKQAARKKAKADMERKKQAYLKRQAEQRRKDEEEAKAASDPCSGKTSRFRSDCR